MKQIFLDNIKQDDSTFPQFIRYFQYNKNDRNPYSTNNDKNGSIGNGAYAYLIDCMHKCVNEETAGFKAIIDILSKYRTPLISKEFVKKNFCLLPISDYSHEAMTKGYNDFVVYVFTNDGKKIPQRYIGLIKEYSSRQCFILIDKEIKNIESFKNIEDIKDTTFNIIIEFKRNLELTLKEIDSLINACSDHIFTNKYDYSYYDENNINTTPENYLYTNYAELSLKSRVEYQGNYDEKNKDYFRQVFANDYRKYITPKSGVSFKREENDDAKVITTANKFSYKQEAYEFIETTDFTAYYNFTFPEEFNVFNTNTGKLLIPGKGQDYTINAKNGIITGITLKDGITNIEVIPNFDNQRRLRVSLTGYTGAVNINDILKAAHFYRWNVEKLQYNIYVNGLLKDKTTEISENEILTVMVIDDLSSPINQELPTSDISCEFIHEDFALPLSVNYMNPFTNSYKEKDSKEWKENEPIYIYEDDSTANIYFSSENKNITDIFNGELNETIKKTSEKYNDNISSRYSDIEEKTQPLRKNLLALYNNSFIKTESGTTIKVSNNTEFVYIKGTKNTLTVNIPELSENYNFILQALNNNNDFIILPIWKHVDNATINIISSDGNVEYGIMQGGN